MPVLSTDDWNIDYVEVGTGNPVVLIHSSVSGNQQWQSLSEALKDCHRVLAVNLFGYGDTTPWPENAVQTHESNFSYSDPKPSESRFARSGKEHIKIRGV